MLVEAPEWEPIEREFVVVLLAINIFWRTSAELWIFFDWWITTIGKSIPNQYEPVRDLPFSWKKVSLRIDSLPTEREMLASIPSLHSRWNCWIATQLFTILPVSHSPPYLSRPIHRSMLGWNASIPIPSFMISGRSRYEIFPVQKHIHAEYSSTSFPSPYRGRNS